MYIVHSTQHALRTFDRITNQMGQSSGNDSNPNFSKLSKLIASFTKIRVTYLQIRFAAVPSCKICKNSPTLLQFRFGWYRYDGIIGFSKQFLPTNWESLPAKFSPFVNSQPSLNFPNPISGLKPLKCLNNFLPTEPYLSRTRLTQSP